MVILSCHGFHLVHMKVVAIEESRKALYYRDGDQDICLVL